MSLGTGRTGLSGPSAPISFATYSDLSAAVAANGGRPLDGTLQARVGDALYVWDPSANGGAGAYVVAVGGNGSLSAPFASIAARDAAMPPGVPRRECYMLNPYAPIATGVDGVVKFVDTGVAWKLAPEQVLADFRNVDGSPILDTTAALLTPGAVAELWASPVLPNWMFDSVISFFCEVALKDASSTANAGLIAGIRTTALANDSGASLLGSFQAVTTSWRGVSGLGAQARCVAGNLKGWAGSNQSAGGAQDVTIGSYADGLTKARIAFAPGAVTNLIRAYSVTIKTGPC